MIEKNLKSELLCPDGKVLIHTLPENKLRLIIQPNHGVFCPAMECETSYTESLVRQIANVKGAAWVCNEIFRDEKKDYLENSLVYGLLGFVREEVFAGKRILDFGCGCGASTSILSRLFPDSEIVGLEYMKDYIDVCESRKEFYGFKNVRFMATPSAGGLPPDLGKFDFVLMCGVFEHLLPDERTGLFIDIWNLLHEGGIMFMNHTPHRYFPLEIHTTSGLPLLNYFPDSIAERYAKTFSKRNLNNMSWNELLRNGIRGSSPDEIIRVLRNNSCNPELLKPRYLDIGDSIDLWFASHGKHSHQGSKLKLYKLLKFFKNITGVELPPYISIAIQKKNQEK